MARAARCGCWRSLRLKERVASLLTVDDLLALPPVPPDVVLNYGPHAEQFGHLYLPARAGPHPVVVLLHGGCWRARVNLEYMGQFARALTQDDIAVWSLEYRRLAAGGGWPKTFLDVAAGADFLRTMAEEYHLDLARVVAVGHSAGGHLALWLAGRHKLNSEDELYVENPLELRGVVSLAGIPDLADALSRNICPDAPDRLMGGTPEEVPERYAQGSPAELLPLEVRQIFIQGDRDDTVPLSYVKLYETAAKKGGEEVSLENLADTGHFEIVVASTPQWQTVRAAVLELLEKGRT